MKILCNISGIEFECQHFPARLTAGESHHPIFDMPLKKLWKFFPKWQSGELTETDSFLYFLSLLNATELVEFRCHVWQRPDTDKIVASNMESLYNIIGRIITIRHPKFAVPRLVVTPETRDLSNVRYWIQSWEQAYSDFSSGLKDSELRSRLARKEIALERLIKNPALHPSKYARMLASWASEAGAFPEFEMRDASGNLTTCSEYWQEIIILCHTDTNIINIPERDLAELIEHCEENLDAGSIQAHQLFNTIRMGLDTLHGFFSIGSPTFAIIGANDDVGTTNLQLLIDSAPLVAPKRTDFPSDFAFMKAKMKYNLAAESRADTATNAAAGNPAIDI